MDAWNEHGWPTKIPTWHTWILWSSSTNGHEVLCIIQIHDHRGVVERLNMILDTSLLKTFLLPFSEVWTCDTSLLKTFICPLGGLNMILDTSLLKTFLCPFGRFEHDTWHKSIEDIFLPFWVLSFVWTLVVSFFFSSCSLAGCFSFIYLLKASLTRKDPRLG
jgi:hypothetical protein